MGGVVRYERTLFEPEHDLFRDSYRAFLDRHAAPYHGQWEEDKIVDRGVWLEAGKAGLPGHGGARRVRRRRRKSRFRYNTIITEETTKGRYSGIGFDLHNDVVAPYLLRLTTDEQKQRWLPQFCTGELDRCIQLHGGYGYMREYPVARGLSRCAGADDLRRNHRDHERNHRSQPRRLAPINIE